MGLLDSIIGGAVSLFGGSKADKAAAKANKQNIQLQRDFAQKGVQWKVADSIAAGVHPLAGLGAQTISFTPSVVGETGVGNALQTMGQDISRGQMATSGVGVRGMNAVLEKLTLERAGLENDLLRSQIRRANAPYVGPPMPDGRTISAFDLSVTPKPGETQAQKVENEYGEFASDAIGATRFARDADPVVTDYLKREIGKVFRNVPNDIFYIKRTSKPRNYSRPNPVRR